MFSKGIWAFIGGILSAEVNGMIDEESSFEQYPKNPSECKINNLSLNAIFL